MREILSFIQVWLKGYKRMRLISGWCRSAGRCLPPERRNRWKYGLPGGAELAAASGFDLTIPMHYDIFLGMEEKPGYFVDYCYENYPYMKTKVMARTERLIYVKD